MTEPLTTTDTFYHGKVIIKQLKRGYRFAVDSPILADFLPVSRSPALEIGCGAGVISLLALRAKKIPGRHRHRDPGNAVPAGRGQCRGQRSAWAFPCHPRRFQQDPCRHRRMCRPFSAIRPFSKQARAGSVQIRPSAWPASRSPSPSPTCSPAAAAILAPRGKLCLIFPFARQEELLATARANGLYPARIRSIQPFADSLPDRFLVQLQKTAKAFAAMRSRWSSSRCKGIYTAEMEKILAGN